MARQVQYSSSDPDLVEGLRLNDSDGEEEVEISRTDDKSGSDGRSKTPSESDPETQKSVVNRSAHRLCEEDSQPEEDIYAPGTYCGLLFDGCVRDLDLTGEKMVLLLEERLKMLRGVPPLAPVREAIKIELPVGSRVKKVSGEMIMRSFFLNRTRRSTEDSGSPTRITTSASLWLDLTTCSQLGLKTSRRPRCSCPFGRG